MLLVSQSFSPSLSSPRLPNLRRSQFSTALPNSFLNYTNVHSLDLDKRRITGNRQGDGGDCRVCRAGLAQDAPFVAAIGACILNSLVFPVYAEKEDDDGDEVIDSTDMRLAVMGFISFIPYFNWLSWVFALLDSGKQRYIVYSIVYLAPYFRTNLSLSPEESWVPIASILLCIIHVQLEISIMNGDITGIFPRSSIEDGNSRVEERRSYRSQLPSAKDEPRDKIRGWEVGQKSAEILRKLKRKENADEEKRKENADEEKRKSD